MARRQSVPSPMSSPQASQRPSTSWKRRCFVASGNDRAAVRRNGLKRPPAEVLVHRGATFLTFSAADPAGNGQINAEFYRNRTGNREFSIESYCPRGEVLRLKMVGEILVWRAARTEA